MSTGPAPPTPAVRLAGLGAWLRAGGMFCPPTAIIDFGQALRLVDARDARAVREVAKAVLLRRHADRERFPALFDAWWFARTAADGATSAPEPPVASRAALQALEMAGNTDTLDEAPLDSGRAATRVSVTDARDIGRLDSHELEQLLPMAAAIGRQLARAPLRRWQPAVNGARLDPARIRRHSLRHGGEMLRLYRRARRRQRLELYLLVDVSGSMRAYARFMLHLAQAFARVGGRLHVSVFATRLADITAQLRQPGTAPEALLAPALPGAGGGTDIGAALAAFHARHAGRLHPRRSSVMILSDGLDCGTPAALAAALGTLRGTVARIVWLNPLLGREGYEPLARGMQAALPWIDDFLPANSVASLAAVAHTAGGFRN